MAKDDSKPRVYMKGDVHKRRAEKKPRAKARKGEGAPDAQASAVVSARDAGKVRPSVKGKPVAPAAPSLTEPIGPPVKEGPEETKPAVSPAAETRPIAAPSKESFSSRLEPDGADEADADGDGVGGAGEGKPKKRWKLRVGIGIAVLLVVALAAGAAVFSWNRWARYDDAADMQGSWYAYGTSVPVTFADGRIVFDANTAYDYEIDAEAKTIRYRIGDLEGQGRYWFSDDRSVLVITDGDGYDKWGTALEDLGHWLGDLFHGANLPVTGKSIAFSRVAMSDGLLTAPESASESESSSASEAEPTSESSSAASGASEASPAPGQPEQPEQPEGQPSPDGSGRDAKDDMKQMPISDIIIEDNTPMYGEETDE